MQYFCLGYKKNHIEHNKKNKIFKKPFQLNNVYF